MFFQSQTLPGVPAQNTSALLHRKCASGGHFGGVRPECQKKQSALQRHSKGIQPKLTITAPDDRYEQEADQMADQVARMTDPHRGIPQRKASENLIQRKCAKCEQEDKTLHQRESSASMNGQAVPSIVHDVLQSPGQALYNETRSFMEPRFGYDFSKVRIHTDEKAQDSARAVSALAYTVGSDVVLGSAQHSPSNQEGQRLLAHELTHVVQQNPADAKSSVNEKTTTKQVQSLNPSLTIVDTPFLQRSADEAAKIDFPPDQEEVAVKSSWTEHDKICENNSLVLSWGQDTCCSNRGFIDPATKDKAKQPCCNTFPNFVDAEAANYGFDGAASCKPAYLGRSATVTPLDKSKTAVDVICTDTRANSNNVIELGRIAAMKAFGKTLLKERAEVCYGQKINATCYHETDCNKTTHPTEAQCLPDGCKKIK